MKWLYSLLVVFVLSAAQPVNGSGALSGVIRPLLAQLPSGAVTGILVKNLGTGEVLFEQGAQRNLIPASTLKLLTAVAAYDRLGGRYRYPTRILLSREPGRTRVYRGQMRVLFSGDPSLQGEQLEALLALLKEKGVREITGDIWLDGSAFVGYPRAEGVVWDDLGICFGAPSTAMVLDRNCFYARLTPGAEGRKPQLTYERSGRLHTLDNQIVTRQPSPGLQCQLESWPSADHDYRLTGCITPDSRSLKLAFAVKDNEQYIRKAVASLLQRLGLSHRGRIRTGQPQVRFPVLLSEHYSAPLAELLKPMLEQSDNLFADSILKTLGLTLTGQGSYETGTEAVAQVLGRRGIDLSSQYLADGSGLSRYNLISAATLVDVLAMAWRTWGETSPWLAQRTDPDRWYKTGTMRDVVTVAGYILSPKKPPLAFAAMVNGVPSRNRAAGESGQDPGERVRHFRQNLMDRLARARL